MTQTFCTDEEILEALTAPEYQYIIVVVDYFTKWAESIPTFNCTAETAARFFFNHVITRFGVPKQLVSDHGSHFEDSIWRELSTLLKFEHFLLAWPFHYFRVFLLLSDSLKLKATMSMNCPGLVKSTRQYHFIYTLLLIP